MGLGASTEARNGLGLNSLCHLSALSVSVVAFVEELSTPQSRRERGGYAENSQVSFVISLAQTSARALFIFVDA